MTYATLVRSETSNQWFIRPLSVDLYTTGFTDYDQAVAIVNALNKAYDTGRAHLQSEFRDLLGAMPATED